MTFRATDDTNTTLKKDVTRTTRTSAAATVGAGGAGAMGGATGGAMLVDDEEMKNLLSQYQRGPTKNNNYSTAGTVD